MQGLIIVLALQYASLSISCVGILLPLQTHKRVHIKTLKGQILEKKNTSVVKY